MIVTVLPLVHTSPETAYVIESYPYGRLRCKRRCWLETNNKGTRFVAQTTNPKKAGEVWNKPHTSTYDDTMGLYLDENGYLQHDGLKLAYTDPEKGRAYLNTFGNACTNHSEVVKFIRLKEIFEEELGRFTPRPDYGSALFKQAYQAAIYRSRKENAVA